MVLYFCIINEHTQETFFINDLANQDELEPQIQRALDRFLDVSSTKRLLIVPLADSRGTVTETDAPVESLFPFGALVIEQFRSNPMHEFLGKSVIH